MTDENGQAVELKAVAPEGPEPELAAPVRVPRTYAPTAPSGWTRDKENASWYRVLAEGDAHGPHLANVTEGQLREFEVASRAGNVDLLRGVKLQERLDRALAWLKEKAAAGAVDDATGTA